MKIRYTKFFGLMTLLGTVAGLVATGMLMSFNVFVALPCAIFALACGILFTLFVWHFIRGSPLGDIPDEEAKDFFRDDD
jgi:hypothetical protein